MFDDNFISYYRLDPPPIKRNTDNYADSYSESRHDSSLNSISDSDYNIVFNNSEEDSPVIQEDPFIAFNLELNFAQDDEFTSYREPLEKVVLKGSKAFEEAFAAASKINPNISKYKNFLVKTAKRESGFNSHIQNRSGAPYYGYFLMGKNEIAMTTKMTVELFRNDPVALILGACKLYDMNLRTIKRIGVYNIGKQRGYSDDALVSGAWMGGPGGVKKYLLGLGDPSDAHWYKKAGQKGGSSVGKIMNNWRANE